MNSDAGGKSALGEELGPNAWAVVAHGRVQKLVVRADVADEAACKWRESDPEATAVPLYSWAAVEAAVAAERERCARIVHRMAVDTEMSDWQSAALFDAERAIKA